MEGDRSQNEVQVACVWEGEITKEVIMVPMIVHK